MPLDNPFQDPLRFERKLPECAVVIFGANGDLTGYGWGLERKRSLLELEGADLGRRPVKPG